MQPANSTPAGRAKPCSILVVEDHGPLRRSVVTWLETRFPACKVTGVETAEEALALAAHSDVVLMDINLQGIDGLEAAALIKALAPDTRVVILTMHDTPHHRRAAAEAGAEGFVAKRDMEIQLEPAVSALLAKRTRSLS